MTMAAAVAPLDPNELLAYARRFVFSVVPDEPDPTERERRTVAVCWRGPSPDAWVIRDRQGSVFNRSGGWEWEPQPSSRSPAFLRRTSFPRDEAVSRALAGLAADRAELAANGFALDAHGVDAFEAARGCARSRNPDAIAACRARLDDRDRVAFDRYLDAHGVAAPQEQA
jgi:hypothetical protein